MPGNWSEVRISPVEALALNLIDTVRADAILAEAQANGLEVRPPVEAGGAPNYERAYVTVYREHQMLSELGLVLTEDWRGFCTIATPSFFHIERPKPHNISSAGLNLFVFSSI